MSPPFDPYHTWLGIPPDEQPPNHYRLLGITIFEGNPEVIANASDRQMLLLRTFQTGERSALSQRLLNEVAAAKICLLNPVKKAAYDEQLRGQLARQEAAGPSEAEVAEPSAASPPGAVPFAPPAAPPVEEAVQPSTGPGATEPGGVEVPVFDFQPTTTRTVRPALSRRGRRLRWNSPIVIAGVTTGVGIVFLLAILALSRGPAEPGGPADLTLEEITPVTAHEGELVTVTARVADSDAWQGEVTYRLGSDAPDRAKIDRRTGEFTWLADAAGEYRVTVRAVAQDAKAADEKAFRINVQKREKPTGKPPVLAVIPDQTVQAGEHLSLSVEVKDPGAPEAELEFRLGPDAPPDMQIDPESGQITWQPAEDSPAGEFPVTVVVVSDAPGNPADKASFAVRVSAREKEPARPPVLAPIADQAVESGEQFAFSVVVEYSGTSEAEVLFGLAPGAPAGMKIDPQIGRVTWTPGRDEPAGKYPVTVLATSTAEDRLSDKKTFTIEVRPAPDSRAREPVPDEPSQTAVLAPVKELFQEEYRQSKPHARLALAARLIRCARESEGQPPERYVMLKEAQRLAVQAGDGPLALAAVDELAESFEVDRVQVKVAALQQVGRQARSPAAAALIAESAFALSEEAFGAEAFESVSALYRQVEGIVRKACGPEHALVVEQQQRRLADRQRLWERSQTAAATLEKNADDPQANLDLGRFHGLIQEDWDKALPLLAKAQDEKLRESAGRLLADATDVAAQLALADAWWELAQQESDESGAKPLLEIAARRWYERALPRLAGLDLRRVQHRLESDQAGQEPEAPQPFRLSLGGLGGLSALGPKKVSGDVSPGGGFATFGGGGGLEYVQVPTPSYVHEFELTFAAPAGSMSLHYGEAHEGARISFAWDAGAQKFICRLSTYRGGWTYWSGSRSYDPGQPLRFTLYVNANRQTLYQDDSRILGTGAHPADLRLRVSTGNGTAAVISRCRFRPWNELDAERVRCPMPPTRIDCDWSETAIRLHERNLGLTDRPNPNDPKPFVVASTGTPMLWIPPGKFNRPHSAQPSQLTEVTITNGFWIGRYEVTQAEWATLGGADSSRVVGSPFLPVDGVGWDDAIKFCTLLCQREGRLRRLPKGYEYRLPTEAEWEYACRAGSQEDFSLQPDGFWSAQNSGWRPHEVGEGKPNSWGVYDMHGNVVEWCFDAWQEEPKTPVWRIQDPLVVPKASGDLRVLRGGAWWTAPAACSSRARLGHQPVAGGHRGFRVVLGLILPRG